MREIKFRGLEVKGKEKGTGGRFVFGSVIYCEEDIESTIINSISEHQVLTETVGQYTGLKDKNGVDIYEGDILYGREEGNGETTAWTYVFKEVFYSVGEAQFQVREKGSINSVWNDPLVDYVDDYVVVSNIHEGE